MKMEKKKKSPQKFRLFRSEVKSLNKIEIYHGFVSSPHIAICTQVYFYFYITYMYLFFILSVPPGEAPKRNRDGQIDRVDE